MANERKRLSVYIPNLQGWIARQIGLAFIEGNVEKFAVIQPEDFIINLSTEQTADELPTPPFEMSFFPSREEALKWIKSS